MLKNYVPGWLEDYIWVFLIILIWLHSFGHFLRFSSSITVKPLIAWPDLDCVIPHLLISLQKCLLSLGNKHCSSHIASPWSLPFSCFCSVFSISLTRTFSALSKHLLRCTVRWSSSTAGWRPCLHSGKWSCCLVPEHPWAGWATRLSWKDNTPESLKSGNTVCSPTNTGGAVSPGSAFALRSTGPINKPMVVWQGCLYFYTTYGKGEAEIPLYSLCSPQDLMGVWFAWSAAAPQQSS